MRFNFSKKAVAFVTAVFMMFGILTFFPEDWFSQMSFLVSAEELNLNLIKTEQICNNAQFTINSIKMCAASEGLCEMTITITKSEDVEWTNSEGLYIYIYGKKTNEENYAKIGGIASTSFGSSTLSFMVDGPDETSPLETYSEIYFDCGYGYGNSTTELKNSFVSCTKIYMSTSSSEENTDDDINNENGIIHISTAADLVEISSSNSKYNGYKDCTIVLDNNIDLSGIEWIPIGTEEAPFRGSIEGNGYTISNMTMNNIKFAGLIGYSEIDGPVSIQNLKISNYKYNSQLDKELVAAVVIAQVNINNGGILNINNITTTNCWTDKMTASWFAHCYWGGVIGKANAAENSQINLSNLNFDDDHNYYINSAEYSAVGGLIGKYFGTDTTSCLTVNKCISTSAVYAMSYYGYCSADAGGLIGAVEKGSINIKQCYVNDRVCGKSYYIHVGGIIGNVTSALLSVSDCNIQPTMLKSECTNGQSTLGGFIGRISGSSGSNISNSLLSCSNTTAALKAGFAAWCGNDQLTVNNSFFNTTTTGISKNECINNTGEWFSSTWITTGLNNSYGITTEQMAMQLTYAGWDFNNVWVMTDDGYPQLRWIVGSNSGNTPLTTEQKVQMTEFINQHYFASIPEYWNSYHEVIDTMVEYDDNWKTEISHAAVIGLNGAVNVITVNIDGVIKTFSSNAYNGILLDMYYDLELNNDEFIQAIYDESVLKSVKEFTDPTISMIKNACGSELDWTEFNEYKFIDKVQEAYNGNSSNKTIYDLLEESGLEYTYDDNYQINLQLKDTVLTESELGEISGLVTGIGSGITFIENYKNIICASVLKNMNESYRQLLIEIKGKVDFVDGPEWAKTDLKNALDYEIYYHEYYALNVTWELGKALYEAASVTDEFKTLKNKMWENFGEKFIKATFPNSADILKNLSTKISAIQLGTQIGWSLSDSMFNLTESTDLYYKGKAYGVFEEILIKILNETAPKLEYCTTSETDSVIKTKYGVAEKFDYAFRMYAYIEANGCQTYSEYNKSIALSDDSANIIKKFFNELGKGLSVGIRFIGHSVEDLVTIVYDTATGQPIDAKDVDPIYETFRIYSELNFNAFYYQNRADFISENLKCHGSEFNTKDGAIQYFQDVSNAYLEMLKEEANLAVVMCPVEVNVYDDSNTYVGTISSEKNTAESVTGVISYRNNILDANVIVYPVNYVIKIVGLDEGQMTVLGAYHSNENTNRIAMYGNVPVYSGYISEFVINGDEDYLISNNSRLNSISVDLTEIADFSADNLIYNVILPKGITAIPTVTATPANANADVDMM